MKRSTTFGKYWINAFQVLDPSNLEHTGENPSPERTSAKSAELTEVVENCSASATIDESGADRGLDQEAVPTDELFLQEDSEEPMPEEPVDMNLTFLEPITLEEDEVFEGVDSMTQDPVSSSKDGSVTQEEGSVTQVGGSVAEGDGSFTQPEEANKENGTTEGVGYYHIFCDPLTRSRLSERRADTAQKRQTKMEIIEIWEGSTFWN